MPQERKPEERGGSRRKKTDRSLVVLDNPDDGEIAESGDNSDFAGEKANRGGRRSAAAGRQRKDAKV